MNSILGALVGDAAGAVLEFKDEISTEDVEAALHMPGGGTWRVGPGQITDDGELTLALWNVLKEHDAHDGVPLSEMMGAYAEWYASFPFDIGRTCGFAFEALYNAREEANGFDADAHAKFVNKINAKSEANGALMRATPIASWVAPYADLSAEYAAQIAIEDAKLSHPNLVCQEANAVYVYTIVLLLRGASPHEAWQKTLEFADAHVESETIKQWLKDSSSLRIDDMKCNVNMGHVKHAFTLAYYFLQNPHISYTDALRMTLQKGGDTDTNAAIVGGLVASYNPIPDFMARPVLTFDCTQMGRKRPAVYSAKQYIDV